MDKETKKEIQNADKMLRELSKQKTCQYNDAEILVCSILKCMILAGEDEYAKIARENIMIEMNLTSEKIDEIIGNLYLPDSYIRKTIISFRDQKLSVPGFPPYSIN